MFRTFDSWSVCGRLTDSTAFRQKQGYTRIYPGSALRRVKTYILFVWSCIACIVGAVTMVRRCNLAEVEGDGVASLSTWDLCEIRCLCEIVLIPSWPPLLTLIWGARSRNPVQVDYRCLRTLTSLGLLGLRASSCTWTVAGRPISRTREVVPSSDIDYIQICFQWY
jgi:hypothetical protein